jgi:hypothetical protein
MITTFEVGAVFKIINEASPALAEILKQVRALNKAITAARENLATIGKSFSTVGLGAAVGETEALAKAWGDVARNAATARGAMGRASGGAGAGGAGAIGGGRGRRRPGWLGGGGAHIAGPGASLPGGGHIRTGGAAMAGAGALGYGIYEASEMEDAVFQLIYHSGQEQNETNRDKFRKVLQDSMLESGYGLKDISESAKQEIRMFQGTKGGGLDVLPEMLRAATTESRLKGESPEESMRALIGLAHMTKQYSPEDIKKLAPGFAFLSTANPASLGSMERAASYAVPLLQSGLGVDPMDTLLLGTALTRAGATNTKSGTWLREMAIRAMPGTSMMSKIAYKKHEEALKAFGLEGADNKPTWFTDGKPDLFKMLDIAGAKAQTIPLDKRAAYERALFGAQGGGGFAMLADPAVREQILALKKEKDSPEFQNRYAGFTKNYEAGSTVQAARTAMADFNITMMDLAKSTLPAVNVALHDFKSVLEGLRSLVPGSEGRSAATIGGRVLEGALIGGGLGLVSPVPGGMLGGAVAGGVIGGVGGIAEAYMKNGHPSAVQEELKNILKRGPEIGAQKPLPTPATPITLNLNINGTALGQALGVIGSNSFDGQAPAFDGLGEHQGGAAQHSDK